MDTENVSSAFNDGSSGVLADAMKLFVKQAASYTSQRTDGNLINLEKQLDVVYNSSFSVSEFDCDSHHVVVTEAISSLILLLNDPEMRTTVGHKILLLFQRWVSNSTLHLLLKTTFQLTSTLTSFLVSYGDRATDVMMVKCLDLLKVMTYNVRISNADVYVDDLLKFLLAHVLKESPASELLGPCMVVLANVCHKNALVQKKIRNIDGAKYCYRSIINKISSPTSDLLKVAALSTFASVAIDEEIGSKFFQSKDTIDTLRLVFHKITNQDADVQCLAIDILIHLLAKDKIQRLLLQCEYLNNYLMKIFLILNKESNTRSVCKVYELLWVVGSQPVLQQIVVKALGEAASTAIGEHPVAVAVHWLSYPPNKLWNPSIWAAKFITELLKISSTSVVHGYLENILSTVTDCFANCYQMHEMQLDAHLEKMAACLKLILCLCQDKNNASKVYSSIGSEFSCVLQFLILHWKNASYVGNKSFVSDFHGEIVDSVLHVLLIMVNIKSSTNAIQEQLYQYLQDVRLMPLFAYALTTSNLLDRVQRAFQLLFLASKLPDFPRISLAEAILETNRLQQQHIQVPECNPHAAQITDRNNLFPLYDKEAFCSRSLYNAESFANFVERFKNSIDMKDVKSSEIMEMYEHKIMSLEMKEKHLLALLDAKANALQHADRVLIEYRSRWARSDAEALQLRSMLQESERRSENAKEEATKALHEIQQRQHDLLIVTEMNSELKQKNDDLKMNCVALHNKIHDLQKSITSLSEEINALSEANTVIKRSRDNFEEKSKELDTLVLKLESDKLNAATLIKEQDSRIKALKQFCKDLELKVEKSYESNVKLTEEKEFLQSELDALRANLCEKEEVNVTLQAELGNCQAQLDKQKEITDLIHSMSARNMRMSGQNQQLQQ